MAPVSSLVVMLGVFLLLLGVYFLLEDGKILWFIIGVMLMVLGVASYFLMVNNMMSKHQNDENTQKSVQLNLLFVIKIWMISTLLRIVCLYLIFIFSESYQEDELELTMIF